MIAKLSRNFFKLPSSLIKSRSLCLSEFLNSPMIQQNKLKARNDNKNSINKISYKKSANSCFSCTLEDNSTKY